MLFSLKMPKFIPVDFQQVFYEIFFAWQALFHFFVVLIFETFLQEQYSRRKKMEGSSLCGNT